MLQYFLLLFLAISTCLVLLQVFLFQLLRLLTSLLRLLQLLG